MRYFVAIPTYNGEVWKTAVDKIREYSPSDLYVRVIDSSSKDDTVAVAKAGFDVTVISSNDFNHGGTVT
jgi:rhamnosyltransferase